MSVQIFDLVTVCNQVGEVIHIDDSTAQVLIGKTVYWVAREDLATPHISCERASQLFKDEPQSNQP